MYYLIVILINAAVMTIAEILLHIEITGKFWAKIVYKIVLMVCGATLLQLISELNLRGHI